MKAFPTLNPGDALFAWHLNVIYRELERLRKTQAAAPLSLDHIDDAFIPPQLSLLDAVPIVPVQLDEALTAGSISAPSSADCTILYGVSGDPGLSGSSGNTDTMYNLSGASVPSGRFCWGYYFNGFLYFLVGDC